MIVSIDLHKKREFVQNKSMSSLFLSYQWGGTDGVFKGIRHDVTKG